MLSPATAPTPRASALESECSPPSQVVLYDNVVSGNFTQGNGLAGISVHSHAPNAYVDGNVFTRNLIGTNNVSHEDGADAAPKDTQTTGILIGLSSQV